MAKVHWATVRLRQEIDIPSMTTDMPNHGTSKPSLTDMQDMENDMPGNGWAKPLY